VFNGVDGSHCTLTLSSEYQTSRRKTLDRFVLFLKQYPYAWISKMRFEYAPDNRKFPIDRTPVPWRMAGGALSRPIGKDSSSSRLMALGRLFDLKIFQPGKSHVSEPIF
jgi:hypothetical protein